MKKIGCIGIGNMGGALLTAICKTVSGADILICDADIEKVTSFTDKYGCQGVTAAEIADAADYILLGVKPQGLPGLLASLSPILTARTEKPVLISMAAGVAMEKIRTLAGCDCPVIRLMPNVAASVGEAMILYDHTADVPADAVADFQVMFAYAGVLLPLAESKIDAGSAISGCGPAYVCLFIEAMADGGVACGLPRATAMELAIQTVIGTGRLLAETGTHPGAMKDAVTSPAGTTIAGVRTLEEKGFRAAVMDAVIAAYERTLGLAK